MKKLVFGMFCISVLVFSIGCSKNKAASAVKPEDAKTLSIWTYFSGNEQKIFQKLVDDFAAQNNITVKAEFLPFGTYKQQLSVAIAGGSLPDIIMIDNPDHAAFAAMNVFEDISDKIKSWENTSAYFEGPLNSVQYKGKYYGIPLTSNCLALFYNVDMLKTANITPPSTWEELRAAAKKLTNQNTFGIGVAMPKSEEATFQFLPWLIASGGRYDTMDSAESIKAVAFLKELIDDGSMSKETINWGQGDIQKQFSVGKLAMFVGGPWMIPQITEDSKGMKFAVAKVPKDVKYASVLGGENIGIVKNKNTELAWKFLQYMGDQKIMKEFISQTGYFPPRKDVAQDPIWTNDPIKKVFMEQMQYAMPRGPHPKWPEMSAAIYTALQEALSGTASPEQACKQAQQVISPLL